MHTFYSVQYAGFLQAVTRYFRTETRARQYARQVGKEREATIAQEAADFLPLTIQ